MANIVGDGNHKFNEIGKSNIEIPSDLLNDDSKNSEILASTLQYVKTENDFMLSLLPGDEKEKLSFDFMQSDKDCDI
ncbi:hypothetical protein CR513_42822, partial [Mucuna pruriens]